MKRDPRVLEVVLTGGPGAGKSSCVPYLRDRLTELGCQVILCPEPATHVFQMGVDIAGAQKDAAGQAAFTIQLLRLHAVMRERCQDLAQSLYPDQRCVIIHDRAECDSAGYLDWQDFLNLLPESKLDLYAARDSYDAVIHMMSPASRYPELYTTTNNQARHETVGEAKFRDQCIQQAWMGHPYFILVPPQINFQAKLNQVTQILSEIVATNLRPRHKRIFKIKDGASVLKHYPSKAFTIVQTHLPSDGEKQLRITRRTGDGQTVHYLTERYRDVDETILEREVVITPTEFLRYQMRSAGRDADVIKTRHCFVWFNHQIELDAYQTPSGLWMAEVETIGLDEAEPLLPPELEVIEEIVDKTHHERLTWNAAA